MDIVNISPKVSGPVSGDIGTAINPPRPVHLLQRIVESKFKEDSNINALHTQEPELIFSPTEHLNISPPCQRFTFKDLKLPRPTTAASPIAATSPFPLFAAAAIPLLRKALLNPAYLNKTASVYSNSTLIIRNTAAYSAFFRKIWTHPMVMRAVSDAAGVELEGMEHAKCMQAISKGLTSGEFALEAAGSGRSGVAVRGQKEIEDEIFGDGGSIIPWHYDSYPFVCVAMLSDTTDMIGGETVIQRGDGTFQGISQPSAGFATILQGGFVRHLALRARGTTDRITLVTSYRAKAVGLYDGSFLTNVRPYTNLNVLYPQWIAFRNKILSREQNLSVPFITKYNRHTERQMIPKLHIDELVARFGIAVFYTVIDGYVSGKVLASAPMACPLCMCKAGGGVGKAHIAICPGVKSKWMPYSELWIDVQRSRAMLRNSSISFEATTCRPDIVAVVEKFRDEGREWGMADELAVQGLAEYLVELLALFGVVVGA
ncbi:uncharacterized protein LAJ45_03942 [Morchella importuna]|uniref:uncharacterized protein n=1 Tax=Morchella importuna TaxID=1174673 RepID=UPI001E8E3173|nr:uncharacterized protein LAJ45_03942 [Morchella importuna]KAH8151949.1 hypothetical protein LAJ45_03942 [Morchella importuna]